MNGELEALISAGTCKCADVQAVKILYSNILRGEAEGGKKCEWRWCKAELSHAPFANARAALCYSVCPGLPSYDVSSCSSCLPMVGSILATTPPHPSDTVGT